MNPARRDAINYHWVWVKPYFRMVKGKLVEVRGHWRVV